VIAVSAVERQHFIDAGADHCTVLGHSLQAAPTPAAFSERAGILFVGALTSASPNEDAILFFAREVLPALRSRFTPDLPVVVAGADMSDGVRALGHALSLRPDVEDLTPLYNSARVFVAPRVLLLEFRSRCSRRHHAAFRWCARGYSRSSWIGELTTTSSSLMARRNLQRPWGAFMRTPLFGSAFALRR